MAVRQARNLAALAPKQLISQAHEPKRHRRAQKRFAPFGTVMKDTAASFTPALTSLLLCLIRRTGKGKQPRLALSQAAVQYTNC